MILKINRAPQKKGENVIKCFIRFSGIILIVIILINLDRDKILNGLSKINIVSVAPFLSLFLGISYLKMHRWKRLLINSNVKISKKYLFPAYIGSFLPGAATPGRIGEIIKYKMVLVESSDESLGFTLSVQDRLWDVSLISLVGFVFLMQIFKNMLLMISLCPIIVISLCLSLRPEFFVKNLYLLMNRFFNSSKFTEKIKCLSEQLVPVPIKEFYSFTFLTICSWLIYFFQVYILVGAAGLDFSFLFLSGVVSTSGLVSMLPISIGGIGTRDLVIIGLFTITNDSSEVAVIISSCILIIFFANCLIAFPFWIYISNIYNKKNTIDSN